MSNKYYQPNNTPVNSRSNQLGSIIKLMNEHLPYMEDGVFLEAGAYDGISWSMTPWLLALGWTGIYVEPHPEFFKQLESNLREFPNAKTFNSALAPQEGVVNLYGNGSLTTTSEKMVRAYHKMPWAATSLEVLNNPMVVKAHVLPWFTLVSEVNHIDLLVLDTEGTELDILMSVDISKYGVQMAVVELYEKSEHEELRHQLPGVDKYMAEHGYVKVHADTINTVYVLE